MVSVQRDERYDSAGAHCLNNASVNKPSALEFSALHTRAFPHYSTVLIGNVPVSAVAELLQHDANVSEQLAL